jgi:hypothetical protein
MKKNDFLRKSLIGDEQGESLPSFRKEQFLYLLRDHYVLVFLAGWFLFLFALPALAFQVYMSYQLSLIAEPTSSDLLSWSLTTYGVMIPLVAILSLGFCGNFALISTLIKGRSATLSTFFKGIKDNGIRALFLGVLCGLVLFLSVFSYIYYAKNISNLPLRYFATTFTLFFGFLVVSFSFYALGVQLRYTNPFGAYLGTSLRLFGRRLLPACLQSVILLAGFIGPAFLQGAWQVGAYLIVFFLAMPLFCLGYNEYQAYAFDKDVNQKLFPDHFREGLDQHKPIE